MRKHQSRFQHDSIRSKARLPHRAALSRISRAEALGGTSSVRHELIPKSRIGELIHRECMS